MRLVSSRLTVKKDLQPRFRVYFYLSLDHSDAVTALKIELRNVYPVKFTRGPRDRSYLMANLLHMNAASPPPRG